MKTTTFENFHLKNIWLGFNFRIPMLLKNSSLLFLFFLIGSLSYGQLIIDAEYRLRSELRDGYKSLSIDSLSPALITFQRTRLNFDYKHDKIHAYISVQDARIWGENKWGTEDPGIGIHQAFIKYSISEQLAVKLGRQEIIYDRNRLMGIKNWGNVPIVHDAAILQFNNEDQTKADLVLAYNNDSDKIYESNYAVDMYKYLTVLRLYNKFSEELNLSFLTIIDGNQAIGNYKKVYARGTSGIFAEINIDNFMIDAMGYYQYGKSKAGIKISSYFFHVKPTFMVNENLKIGLGIDYLSGDNALDNNNKDNAFSTVFGDGHGFYGYMDYFTNIPTHTNRGGLNDIYLQADYKLSPKLSLTGAIHNFRLTNNILDVGSTPINPTAAKKQLGIELDAVLAYKFYPNSTLTVGYSAMMAQKSMELIKIGSSKGVQNWLFVAVIFKPELFRSINKETPK
ncbi:MAG: alginate export family protein [Salinivirgaceae bacterium]|nr:alginate export family protein [Salinivirgaceae bacterium]